MFFLIVILLPSNAANKALAYFRNRRTSCFTSATGATTESKFMFDLLEKVVL
jgi:hypothetical protein